MAIGQVAHPLSENDLFPVKGFIILAGSGCDDKMIGLDCLDDDPALLQAPPCPSGRLGHQLKSLFLSAKLACTQSWSADKMADKVTLGKSWPLAII